MKPIETKYKGYKFRSRLEARWAVFFDSLNVKWEYESKYFDLDDLGYYLPDFYLSDYEMFVEIKPTGASFQRQEYTTAVAKIEALNAERERSIIVCGSPGIDTYVIPFFRNSEYESVFALDKSCTCLVIIGDYGQHPLACSTCPRPRYCSEERTYRHHGLFSSYKAVRAAQFEPKSPVQIRGRG